MTKSYDLTLHQVSWMYKYIPHPTPIFFFFKLNNYVLKPCSNLQKLLKMSSTWVQFSVFQYTKFPHTVFPVLMLDTLVKGFPHQKFQTSLPPYIV
jgi:hypothetical protein